MNFRDRYLEALGIITQDSHQQERQEDSKLKAACTLAHDIRQFEIELYWKRATYFWAFQLIAFTALGLLFKEGQVKSLRLLLIPAPIGVITAYAGYLTARGSKFWQENWEAHVDLLEDEMKQRLTQVVICRNPPQFSVSRINQSLMVLLTLGWTLVLVFGAIPESPKVAEFIEDHLRSLWSPLPGVLLLVAVAVGCWWMRRSTDLPGRIFRLGETDWKEYPSKRKRPLPAIIWRDPLHQRGARTSECSSATTAAEPSAAPSRPS